MSAMDRLWQCADKQSWGEKPAKCDVEPMAAALQPSDRVEGVWRISWSTFSTGALAITSSAVLVGCQFPGARFKGLLASSPAHYRSSSKALAVPREDIRRVVLTAEAITLFTDAGSVRLLLPAGSNRYSELEQALRRLAPAGESGATETRAPAAQRTSYPGLWSGRDLVDGSLLIRPRARTALPEPRGWIASSGRAWRRMPSKAQWALALALCVGLQAIASPAGVVFGVLLVVFLAISSPEAVAKRMQRGGTPEGELAESETIEARVAGAATRAWDETVQEPSWSSDALAGARAAFDGKQEVDAIVDLAVRIHAARRQLGSRPEGPAAAVWQQQWTALDQAALRLGERADSLIRHRDQAAELSRELVQLGELERLERSALVIDDLTLETSAGAPFHHHSSVSDQIEAARAAVGELIDLMTRTRAPLAEPIEPSSLVSAAPGGFAERRASDAVVRHGG
jgi:hypothetical protein